MQSKFRYLVLFALRQTREFQMSFELRVHNISMETFQLQAR
jgi:hypothetical protein